MLKLSNGEPLELPARSCLYSVRSMCTNKRSLSVYMNRKCLVETEFVRCVLCYTALQDITHLTVLKLRQITLQLL